MTQRRITDDLHALLGVLPPLVAEAVVKANNSDNLLEIILDLGRSPVARFVDSEVILRPEEVAHTDIDFVVSRIGEFDADNRAGLERTLHRISAIRNRRSHIVGLTCRVGRAVYGTIDIIQDLVESGKSMLILGQARHRQDYHAARSRPYPGGRASGLSSLILRTKSAATGMCPTRPLAGRAACRSPRLPYSTK